MIPRFVSINSLILDVYLQIQLQCHSYTEISSHSFLFSCLPSKISNFTIHAFKFCDEGLAVPYLDKGKMIENIFGDPIPDAINVRPPDVVHTKGSGSRKVSKKEAAIRQMNKPLRRCAKCREMVRHDSRNCGKEKEKNKNK